MGAPREHADGHHKYELDRQRCGGHKNSPFHPGGTPYCGLCARIIFCIVYQKKNLLANFRISIWSKASPSFAPFFGTFSPCGFAAKVLYYALRVF